MIGNSREEVLESIVKGAAALPPAGIALACLVLRDHVPCPLWIVFIPPFLAWASIGLAGLDMQSLLGSLALSVALSPLLAAGLVLLPSGSSEASRVAFTALRQSIAAAIGIMAPLSLVSTSIGGAIRASLDRAKPPTWTK
ncbi:MAG: hypothetical protein BWY92_00634 [Firmicutes bacterium ADurb.BinA052]|jgi:hypothetical protein|nr:MAG: hypothetical protein BWY92_00634 [Firmicutes bacterium ADurb.BinA052]